VRSLNGTLGGIGERYAGPTTFRDLAGYVAA
jgi:hypothetical protein